MEGSKGEAERVHIPVPAMPKNSSLVPNTTVTATVLSLSLSSYSPDPPAVSLEQKNIRKEGSCKRLPGLHEAVPFSKHLTADEGHIRWLKSEGTQYKAGEHKDCLLVLSHD
ncbi:hypothetical protein E2C01_043509 [Portunus trituberculatus]|uniref:Uncharacterized protein n=1 Tax=Portunus trituberculatus TaxID=210409 RepID=A0A5B7FVX4_PORTR|nr:hypothetical protein [Portunus trituberculatus]